MKRYDTAYFIIAGVFWAIQTVLSLINVFSSEIEGLGMIIGIGLVVCEGLCAYALFIGDAYKFYNNIKILSIAVTVAVVIIVLALIRMLSILPGVFLGMVLVLGLLVADYWSLTDVAKKADDNISVEKSWFIPGAIYLATIIVSYAFVQSIASKYGVNMDVGSVLISDNLVMLIFSTALFFFTGYAFNAAQNSVIDATSSNQPSQNYQNNVPNFGSNVFGNIQNYSGNVQNENVQSQNEQTQNVQNENVQGQNVQTDTEKTSSSKFTLKKD